MPDVIFNPIEWKHYSHIDTDGSDDENIDDVGKFTIQIFGKTDDGKDVFVRVDKFTPYFLIEVPDKFDDSDISKLMKYVKEYKVWKKFKNTLVSYKIVKRHKFYGFTNKRKFKFVALFFNNYNGMMQYERVFQNRLKIPFHDNEFRLYTVYESNIDPILRCMHIRNLKSCGWIRIKADDCMKLYGVAHADIQISTKWNKLHPEDSKTDIAKFKVLSFDIECTSSDGSFPQASRKGDKIIQIGSTFNYYGEMECYKKHIVTLGSCDPIEGVEIESYESEEDLLLAWRDLVIRENPDVLTGYNIFYFDWRYIYERAKYFGIFNEFCKLGRIVDEKCKWKEKKLSSSALGDNNLQFMDCSGRVQIDVMKVVQRDYALSSYKLDNVAEHFLGDRKDDIKPADIFRLQKGGSADRRLVAKYCVQDCALCNRLITKLEIMTNNIGMANVCSVPLSYIFLRGQGVKVFSLVAKRCRELNYVMPVVRKGEEEDDGFEGAFVFKPIPGFYRNPISVLDYASLYPRSMIDRNLSHEMIVTDPMYDNLEGYIYRDVYYNSNSGERVKCRFAEEKSGEKRKHIKGIIPNILLDLLNERTATKNLMKKEKDPFRLKILDGLQLALKVTCNSIYGQIGAPTSPIFLKDIAACTTATGKEMLEVAKKFAEKTFPKYIKNMNKCILEKDVKGLTELVRKAFDNETYPEEDIEQSKKVVRHYFGKDIDEILKNTKFCKDVIKSLTFIKTFCENYTCKPFTMYGDTDSIFVNYDIRRLKDGKSRIDKKGLELSIQLGLLNGLLIKSELPYPHDLEYEKTFWPFMIVAKKKYVGNKYEFSVEKFEQTSMGIVLKRRDNANIVKKIVGGMVDILLNEIDVNKAVDYMRKSIKDLLDGKYPLEDFITTKTLKSNYANRDSIAHAVLADRMAKRDPGNKPQTNDRISFVTIETKGNTKKMLQGDRIEHPDYIRENNIKVDYAFYLTNQIMNPSIQFLELIIDNPKDIFNKFIQDDIDRKKGRTKITAFSGFFVKSGKDENKLNLKDAEAMVDNDYSSD